MTMHIETCVVATEAHAAQYGELRIRSNTTLTTDRYGDVVFDADDITLDCANHQVHISSYTKLNHGSKAAIYADSKTGITIKNCVIVGGFDHSLQIENSASVTVSNVTASTTAVFFNDNRTAATGLTLSGSIGLILASDMGGSYSANIGCQFQGIMIHGAINTRIANTTVSGCSGAGMIGESNRGLIIENVVVENSQNGLELGPNDSFHVIRNSAFRNNTYNGLALYSCTNAAISSNTASGNGACDATADAASTGNSWAGNNFGTACGNIPTPH
jgi:hypothetical protein